MKSNAKKTWILFFVTLIVDVRADLPLKESEPSPVVNDSFAKPAFFEVALSTDSNDIVAVANANVSYLEDHFYPITSNRSWATLSKIYVISTTGHDTFESLKQTGGRNTCELLYLSVLPQKEFSRYHLRAMNGLSGPVVADIMVNDVVAEEKVEEISTVHVSHPFYGVLLAVVAACLVGASFIFQKKALIKTEVRKTKTSFIRSGSCGEFAYLTECVWWCGMLSMAIGEILNFVAYSIAPAILITPLGALRVIVSAVLSSMFLNEKLNILGKIGVFLSLVGSVMIIIHAPRHEKVKTFQQFVEHFTDTTFLVYCIILVMITVFLIVHVAPRYGRSNALVYISVCNIIGALCVLCGKGLGISLKDIGQLGEYVYLHPVFWVLILTNVVGIVAQIVYLNKSLAFFETSLIIPIRYVFTNVFLIFGSILLFQEFTYMSIEDMIGMGCGFCTVVVGVVLLNSFKNGYTQVKDDGYL